MENSENKMNKEPLPNNPKKSNGRAYTVNVKDIKGTSEDLTPEQNAYVRAFYSRNVDCQVAAGAIPKEDRDFTVKSFCDSLFRMPDENINAVIEAEKAYRAKPEEARKKEDANTINAYKILKKRMDYEMAKMEKADARKEKFDNFKDSVKKKIDNNSILNKIKGRMGR